MQSYASGSEKQHKHKTSGISNNALKKIEHQQKANQPLGEENFCYMSDDCQQANECQQVIDEDKDAKGFNDRVTVSHYLNQVQDLKPEQEQKTVPILRKEKE
jgi:hypothetical protein